MRTRKACLAQTECAFSDVSILCHRNYSSAHLTHLIYLSIPSRLLARREIPPTPFDAGANDSMEVSRLTGEDPEDEGPGRRSLSGESPSLARSPDSVVRSLRDLVTEKDEEIEELKSSMQLIERSAVCVDLA